MSIKTKVFNIIISSILVLSLTSCSKPTSKKADEPVEKTNTTEDNTKKTESVPPKETLDAESFKEPFKGPNKGVPVLMYHSVSKDQGNPINPVIISPDLLEQEFEYIKNNGYTPISLDALYNYLENNGQIPEKSLVLTFDDGYKDNYTELFPLLKKYKFRATIYVVTDYIDKSDGYLTSDQLKEMDSYGVDIESHTVTHPYLNKLTKDKQLTELKESKAFLEKLLNKKVNHIAYPYGAYNADTVAAAKEAGYKSGITTDGKWSMKKNGILSLDRVYISSQFGVDVFKERISNPNYKSIGATKSKK